MNRIPLLLNYHQSLLTRLLTNLCMHPSTSFYKVNQITSHSSLPLLPTCQPNGSFHFLKFSSTSLVPQDHSTCCFLHLELQFFHQVNPKKPSNPSLKVTSSGQWLRICLAMQGTRVRSLVWENPTHLGAAELVYHHYWSQNSKACKSQLLSPQCSYWSLESETREATAMRSPHVEAREQPLLITTR